MTQTNYLRFSSLLFFFHFIGFAPAFAQKSTLLSQQDFKKQISGKKVQLIDVRTPDEFNGGHIKNARNIDYMSSDFKSKIASLDKSKPVYVYCQAGGRSARAAKIFVDAGFKEVYDLQGGFGNWKE